MSRKRIRRIIIAVSVFYLLVAVIALIMLKDSDSELTKRSMADILFEKESGTDQDSSGQSSEQGYDPDRILDKWDTEQTGDNTESLIPDNTEAITGGHTEAVTETRTEPVTEKQTESVTVKPTEAVTEQQTETVTGKKVEDVAGQPTEQGTEEQTESAAGSLPQTDGQYYVFESTNQLYLLSMRESASKKSKTVASLKPHTKGVVLERGDQWTKIAANKKIGYCYNQYLDIKEVTKEEYDKQLEATGAKIEGEQNGVR